MKMHEDEVDIDAELAGRSVRQQGETTVGKSVRSSDAIERPTSGSWL